MDLVLTVAVGPIGVNMLKHTKVFTERGGSLGRAADNEWVLPDTERVVSAHHASIEFLDGRYLIRDTSTNGTYLNEAEEPLGADTTYCLCQGDTIACGDYRLNVEFRAADLPKGLDAVDFLDHSAHTKLSVAGKVIPAGPDKPDEFDSWLNPVAADPAPLAEQSWGSVTTEFDPAPATGNSDPIAALDTPAHDAKHSSAALVALVSNDSEVDPLQVMDRQAGIHPSPTAGWSDDEHWWKAESHADHTGADAQAIKAPVSTSTRQPPASPPSDTAATIENTPAAFALPDAEIKATNIDEVWGISSRTTKTADSEHQKISLQEGPLPAVPTPPQVAPQAPKPEALTSTNDLQRLAIGLGLNQLEDQQLQHLAPEASAIINETINRLIDLLRARSTIKNELRVERTIIQTFDNNPLKFSATADAALKTMFSAEQTGFMPPREAVRESFDDLSDHQVALLSGMRAAYRAMLKHFEPRNLEGHLQPEKSRFGQRHAKHWDAFQRYYAELEQDREATYNQLFGEAFTRAYERQLAELKHGRVMKCQP